MTNTNGSQSAVLMAYASANKRAEQALESVRERFQPPLEAATSALQFARDNDLKGLNATLERAYVKACQKFESSYRRASNDHGRAMTQVLQELEARRAAIGGEHDDYVQEARDHYQLVCHSARDHSHPSCLPAYDALMAREAEADLERDRKLADSRAIYLADKEHLDAELASAIEAMTREKIETCEQAKIDNERAVEALITPLQAAVDEAQTALTLALGDATAIHHRLRQLRLDILGAFERHSINEEQAIRALDLLWAESTASSATN
ncbi:MAG: hypothetical protein KGS72_26900 [Cyanobacteria bacterium REEB67]|nr:hypothetical protein [Cyanobacteria bacterium REEB67]